jgi:pimeloyl-ACP methyl ester carboxylesterase
LDAGAPFARPSLIVAGRHDSSVGFKDATRLLPRFARSTFVILDRAEHGLPIDQQTIFESLVIDWLDRMVKHSTHLEALGDAAVGAALKGREE